MKPSNLCTKFACGATKGKASNMFIDLNKIFSYGTILAQRDSMGYILLNTTKYSSSISRSQSCLNDEIHRVYDQSQIIEVENVPMLAKDLRYYCLMGEEEVE